MPSGSKYVNSLIAGEGYITTPNVFRILIRMLTFECVGILVVEILIVIAYGHHWKKYNHKDIRNYLARMYPDFMLETSTYFEGDGDKCLISEAFVIFPAFLYNIAFVIRLHDQTNFLVPSVLPMVSVVASRN